MTYQHHSERIYTARSLAAIADRDIPSRVKPLLALYIRLSRNGTRAVFASAEWMAKALGRSVSTYYEHRDVLVKLRLIEVTERRLRYAVSNTSLVTVRSVRDIAKGVYRVFLAAVRMAREAREARKCYPPENRRQTGRGITPTSKKRECAPLRGANAPNKGAARPVEAGPHATKEKLAAIMAANRAAARP